MNPIHTKPSIAFVGASWSAMLLGFAAYVTGLWRASMQLNEKGYYLVIILYGLFAAISLQKSVRDRVEGVPVSAMYFGLAWFSLIFAVLLLCIGLWNATLQPSEKGFYAMSFVLSLFGSIAVQKNTRDNEAAERA